MENNCFVQRLIINGYSKGKLLKNKLRPETLLRILISFVILIIFEILFVK